MNNETHPIGGLVDSALKNLRTLVDADTVIGQTIVAPDGTVIIPVSKVSFGFAAGGSDIPTTKQGEPFGGGSGGGVTVQPLAFLVILDGKVQLLQVNDNRNSTDRLVGLVPELVDKLGAMLKSDKKKEHGSEEPAKEKPIKEKPEKE